MYLSGGGDGVFCRLHERLGFVTTGLVVMWERKAATGWEGSVGGSGVEGLGDGSEG